MTKVTLRFRAVNRDIFNAIRRGKKKIETRAATTRYRRIKAGDLVTFVCEKARFTKKIRGVQMFRSVGALTKAYKPYAINPKCRTANELKAMYRTFPSYQEKMKRYGIVAFRL